MEAGSPAKVAVLVSSSDGYSDLWRPFFTLFHRYWPDCPYPVFLGSETRSYDDPAVRSLTVGEEPVWTTCLAGMLQRIDEPYVLLLLEDYLLTGPVDTARIGRLVDYMVERGAACMRLVPVPGAPAAAADFADAGELPKGMRYRLSTQAAVWPKSVLLDLIESGGGESAWEFELQGTPRTDAFAEPFLAVLRDARWPLPYFCTAVVRGAWRRDAVALCRRERVPVDLDARPRESIRVYLGRRKRRFRELVQARRERLRRPQAS